MTSFGTIVVGGRDAEAFMKYVCGGGMSVPAGRYRLVQFRLRDPEPLLHHAEPILRDGALAGYLTSGNYGHTLGAAIGLGYVACAGEDAASVLASRYEIEIAGRRVAAEASLKPMYDPKSERMKA